MTKEITREYFEITNEKKTLLSILNVTSFKIIIFKIIYDGNDISLQSQNLNNRKVKGNKIPLNEFLIKLEKYECHEFKNEINSFDFYVNLNTDSKKIILCHKCYQKNKEKENYISLEDHISKCAQHHDKYGFYCLNCKKNICEKCKPHHMELRHEFTDFNQFTSKWDDEIYIKQNCCNKAKKVLKIFQNISEIKLMEMNIKESSEIDAFIKRLKNEIKYAELIISAFQYFCAKKSFCYELISNFHELQFNEKIKESINFLKIFGDFKNILQPSFHFIMKSPDTMELNRAIIIPLSQRKKIVSNVCLNGEIRGIIELKGGYFLGGTKNADIGIYNSKDLQLKAKLKLLNLGIKQINHLSKIKDDNLDLIAVASNLNDIIIISVFHEQKDEDIIFDYRIECQIKSHLDNINRIIQLSNNLIVSSSADGYIMFWEKNKNNNAISLQFNSKINLKINVYNLFECQYTNELICNYITIDLKTFKVKRKLSIWFSQDESFNCAMCLFYKKYLAYVSDCDGVIVIDLDNISKTYYITAKYDYVDAVYTIDDETLCVCTRDLYNIFQPKYSQQYKLVENHFKEIGKICHTGTCNCFMNDSQGNFIMGNMSGDLVKYLEE